MSQGAFRGQKQNNYNFSLNKIFLYIKAFVHFAKTYKLPAVYIALGTD